MNSSKLCWTLLLLASLAGCTSTQYDLLTSEMDNASLQPLLAAYEEKPTTTYYIPTQRGDEPPADLAIHITGCETAERGIILVHGCATDAQSWRFVSGDLGADHRLILVDLLGCGKSDCPDPATLGPDGYSPDAMADRVLQALNACMKNGDLPERLTLVGHSLGGAIALRMMGSEEKRVHYADLLTRIDRMVLLTPLDVEFINPPEVFKRIATMPPYLFELADTLGILREVVAEGIYNAPFDRRFALREDANKRLEMLTRRESLLANQAILRQACPFDGDHLDWDAARRMTADYANVDVPCVILWGAYDDMLPVSMGYKIAHELPAAALYIVPDCKHSAQLEHPKYCADTIRRFSAAEEPLALDYSYPDTRMADSQGGE
ncbi:MAG: alpha/beta hydrolase [Planctomycetes bacterium]|nr:alpha/beta hydrolase [Planctomycetota bacterium]